MGLRGKNEVDLHLMRKKAEALFELEKSKIKLPDNIEDLQKQNRELRIAQIQQELQINEKLNQSEERYQRLIEFAPDAFFQGDENGKIIAVNKKAIEYTGYAKKELIGMRLSDLFSDKELEQKPLRFDLIDKLDSIKAERNLLRKNGEIIRIEMNSKKMSDGTYQSFFRDITERIKTKQTLQESYNLLEKLSQQVPGVIYQYQLFPDGTSCFPYSSSGIRLIYEVNPEDVIKDASLVFERLHPDDLMRISDEIKESARLQTPFHSEFKVLLPKQGLRWRLCNAVPELLDDGSTMWYGIITDITDRKEIEKRMADERILLRTLIDNLPDAVYAKDIDGRKLFSNRVDLRNQGLISESQVIGKTDFDIFPVKMAEKFHEIDQIVIDTGKSIIDHKEEYIFEDNREHWLLSSKFPLRNDQEEIIGIVGISRDISQKVKAEQEIYKLTAGMNQSPASIVITNTNGEIEYANRKFIEISGYTEKELKGNKLRILKEENKSSEIYQSIWNSIESGKEWRGEHLNTRKNKESYWESVLISPIKNNEGGIINFIIISADITRAKRMEAELIKSKEKAEESDRLKTAFLNNMSHEIRTPLNAIIGFSELLTDPDIEVEESNYYIEILHNSSDQLLHIISDIINISTIDAGQMKAVMKSTNINNLLISLSEQFILSNKNENIDVRYISTLNDQEALVETDETKLTQTLSNLIVNALKFTEKGKVEFGVTKNDAFLHFWVEDTGIGISDEMHEKIFDRFSQANSSILKLYGGTGLGLSIAKSIIELLGGEIGLTSKEGEGSRFYFNIPYKPI